MPKQVIWSPLAENDFSSILQYLQDNWESKVVSMFIDVADEVINQIIINPKQFPVIKKKEKIRKCVITKHNTLYYRERKDQIDILRIFDNRQNPKKLKFI
jgi:plasmid stabilization system protein ParE